jgi:hypothetical protein
MKAMQELTELRMQIEAPDLTENMRADSMHAGRTNLAQCKDQGAGIHRRLCSTDVLLAVQALLKQLAGMRLATAKDDPFGGSAVWAT